MHSGRWGSKAYIESLHRTYNVALPRRDDESFERALKFREREKNHYKQLQEENDALRQHVGILQYDVQRLSKHADVLLKHYDDTKTSSNRESHDNDQSSNDGASGERSDGGGSVAAGAGRVKGGGEGRADEMPGEVLPTELPDPGGSGTEHARDGSESREGAENGSDAADAK